MQILLVDDDRKSRDKLEAILAKAGNEVAATDNATDAFKIYQERKFDIVFIGWSIPGISGTELCRIIRDYNLKTGQVSYLILVSKKTQKRNMVEGLDAGVDDFVLKPYSIAVVLSRVEVAKRVLETKFNRLPKVQPLRERTIEPVEVLNKEHALVHKMTGVLEMVANMLGEGMPIPKKLLVWATSSAFMLNWQLHEEKELFYIDLFVARAQEIHGKTSQLYSRSSLTQILKEHELIKKLLTEMQDAARKYSVDNPKSASRLREGIIRYLPLIRFHASREEDVFLPFSQRYLTDEDAARIMRDFKRTEDEVGADAIKTRLETIEELERILKIKEKAV